MSRYNEIYQRTWESESFKSLSKPEANAQTLWLYLLSGRVKTPIPGIYGIGLGALQDYLKWSRESLEECFNELVENDMAYIDIENNVIYLPNWYKWNKPQNPNVLKGWLKLLDNIPDCDYKTAYIQQLKEMCESLGESFKEQLKNHYGNDTAIPEPKPEPEPEPKNNAHNNSLENTYFSQFWELYPKKQDKKKAEIKFIAYLKKQKDKDEAFRQIMDGLRKLIDWREQKNKAGEWVPEYKNAKTWINGECWNDELIIEKKEIINDINPYKVMGE